jgi:internalin A
MIADPKVRRSGPRASSGTAQGHTADVADYVRRVMRVVSAEVTECPYLFTIVPMRATGLKRWRFYQRHYRLTLWRQHPRNWHPWAVASYDLDPPRKWFAQISPYASLVLVTLQHVIPVFGAAAGLVLPADQLARAQGDLQLMGSLLNNFSDNSGRDLREIDFAEPTGELTHAEGEALRAIRAIIFEQDRLQVFGRLSRAQRRSGDYIWVCLKAVPRIHLQ